MFGRGRLGSNDTDQDPEPDLSPMIDCVFILLIFFIVTAVFVEEDGIVLNRPEDSASTSQLENTTVLFEVEGDSIVRFEGNPISVDGVKAIVEAKLQSDEDAPIVIQSNQDASHGLRVAVHDQARAGGAPISGITLTSR